MSGHRPPIGRKRGALRPGRSMRVRWIFSWCVLLLGAGGACLFLNAEVFGGGFENRAVDFLFRQAYLVKADAVGPASDALKIDVKPVLLFHGVAAALVVTGQVSLFTFLLRSVMESFAQQDTPGGSACDRGGITVGEFVGECSAASAHGDIADRAGGGAAGEEGNNREGKHGVDDFHKL